MEGFDEAKMKQLQLLKEKMKLAKSQKQEEAQKNEESGLNETKKDLNDVKNGRPFDVKDARFNKTGSKKFDGFFSNKKIGYPKGSRYPFQQSKSAGFASKKGGVNKPANEVDLFDTPLTFEEVMRRKHERKKLELQKGNNEMENKNDVSNSKQGSAGGDKQENGDNDNSGNIGDHGNTGGGSFGINGNDQVYKRFSSENIQNSTFDFNKTDNINSLGIKDSQYFSLPEFQKNESVTNDKMLNNSVHPLHETKDKQIPLHVESAIQMIDANNTSYIYHEVLMDISSNANNVLSAKINNINLNGNNVHKNQNAGSFPTTSDVNTGAKSYSLNNSGVKWREEEVVCNLTTPNEKLRQGNEEEKRVKENEKENVDNKSQIMPQNIISVPKNHDMKTNELRNENKNDTPCGDNASTFLGNSFKERNTNHWVPGGLAAVANLSNMLEPLNNASNAAVAEGAVNSGRCVIGNRNGTLGNSTECSNKHDVKFGNGSIGQNIFANATKILETNRTIFGTNVDINNGSGTNRSSLGNGNTVMTVKDSATHLWNVSTRNNISNTANYMKSMSSNRYLSNEGFLMKTEHIAEPGIIGSTHSNFPINSVTTFVKKNNLECSFEGGNFKSTNMSSVANSLTNKGLPIVGNTINNNNNNSNNSAWEDVNKNRLQENTFMIEGLKYCKNPLLNMPRNTNQNICTNNENQGSISSKHSSDTYVCGMANSLDVKLDPIEKGMNSTVILNNSVCGTLKEDFTSTNKVVENVNVVDKSGTDATNISASFRNSITRSAPNTNTNTTTTTATGGMNSVKELYTPTPLNSGIQIDSKNDQGSLSFNNEHMPGETCTSVENGSIIYARNTNIDTCSSAKGNNNTVYLEQTANTNKQQIFKSHIRQEEINNALALNEPTVDENKDILKGQGDQKNSELTEQMKENVADYIEVISSRVLSSHGTVTLTNTESGKEKHSATVENTHHHVNCMNDARKDRNISSSEHMMNQSIILKNDVNVNKGVTGISVNFANNNETIDSLNEWNKVDMSIEKDTYNITSVNSTDLEKIKGNMAATQTDKNFNQDSVEISNVQGKQRDTHIVTTSNNNVNIEKIKALNNNFESINNSMTYAEKNVATLENNQRSIFTQERASNSVIPKNEMKSSNECKSTTTCIIPLESTKGEGNRVMEEVFNKTITNKKAQSCLSNEDKMPIISVEPLYKEKYVKCKNMIQVEENNEWNNRKQMSLGVTEKMNTVVESREIRVSPEEIKDNKGKEHDEEKEEQKNHPTTMETVIEEATGTVAEELAETMTEVVANVTETKLETAKIEQEEKEQGKEEETKKEENNDSFSSHNTGNNSKDQGDIFQIFQKNGDNMLYLNAEQFGNKEDFDKINQIYKNIGCINKNIIYMNKYIPSNIENVHDYINKNNRCMENYDALVKTNKMCLEKIKNENNSEKVNAELKTMINNLNKQMTGTEADEKVIKQQPPVVANEEVEQNLPVDVCSRNKMEFLNHSANDGVSPSEGGADSSDKIPEHVKRILLKREYFNGARKMQINENTEENRKNQIRVEHDSEQNVNCKKMKPYVSLECREMFRNTFYTNVGNKNHLFGMNHKIQNNATRNEQMGITAENSVDAKVCLANDTHNGVPTEIKMYTENDVRMLEIKNELNQDPLEQRKNIACENKNSLTIVPKDELGVKSEVCKNIAPGFVMRTVTTGSVGIIPEHTQEANAQMEKEKQVEMQNEIKNVTEFVTKLYEHINTNDYINLGTVTRKKRKQEDINDFIDTDGSIEYKMSKLHLEDIEDVTNEEEKANQKEGHNKNQNTKQKEVQKENGETGFMNMHNHVMAITNAKTLEDFASGLTKYTYDSEKILCDIITKNFDLSVKINSLNDLPFLFEELP